jgi:PEP-CTERM motif
MKKAILTLAAICLGLSIAPAASATTTSCTAVQAAGLVSPGATLFDQLLIQPTFNGTNPAGTFDSCVFAGDAVDPAVATDPNALSFVYGSTIISGGPASFAVNCTGCVAPIASNFGLGEATWFFDKPIGPATTDYLFVYTNSDVDNLVIAQLNDTSNSRADALATVPEPGSIALVGTGLIGLAGLLRRKFLQA